MVAICQIARRQTIHHNLLADYGIPGATWDRMRRVRPPRARDALRALSEVAPHSLRDERIPAQRVVGACILAY